MSVSPLGRGARAARPARVSTGSDRAGLVLLSRRRDGSCWSGWRWQGAELLPAGEERVLPWPVRADLQDSLPGVDGEAGGDVPDPVAERVRVGVPQLAVVAAAEEAGPGGQVGGDVRRDDPAAVDLPGLRREVPQAHGLGGADAARLDDGVLAVDHVDVLGWWLPGTPAIPASGMFVQVMEYFQPVF